ncbi:helix-turn-helix domain-containing protein [Streptomyces sp. CoH27]|uniref:helix-turn-helix domain-containing protein n=1 Tax=Streptomyces sp. CoH27 TaxID=2875763 RepID=UPI001CD30D4C|nr:helix-turn-helix domain-containing protein [Streptomyces sp. CoH27]
MTPVIDTAGFPDGGNSVRRWSRAVSKATVPVTVASYGAPTMEGRMTTHPLGHLLFVTTDADPQCFTRSRRRIARDAGQTEPFVVVAVVGDTGAVLQQGGRTAELAAGTLALWDTERPHVVDFPRSVHIKACLVPRRAIGVRDDELERVTATVIDADGPVAALVAPLLVTLAETAVDCPEHVADRLARNFTDLVTTLIAERAAGDVADTVGSRQAQAWEVRAYVDRHLGDPELGPETIAAAHSMSVRSLHKLFEGERTTVSRLIQRRRLEECARDLARGDSGDGTISGVARRWGFSSPAHFSRLFHAAHGMPPSRWRDTRGGAASSDPSAVVDGPLPTPAENDRVTPRDPRHAPRRREKRNRGPSVAKRSKTVDLTCGEAATHGGLVGSRDLRDSTHGLMCFHAAGERGHGPIPASAGECGQEGA